MSENKRCEQEKLTGLACPETCGYCEASYNFTSKDSQEGERVEHFLPGILLPVVIVPVRNTTNSCNNCKGISESCDNGGAWMYCDALQILLRDKTFDETGEKDGCNLFRPKNPPVKEEGERVYRWVKGRKRLPDDNKSYPVQWVSINGQSDNLLLTTRTRIEDLASREPDLNVEWLEKVPAPIPQPVSTDDGTNEYEKWLNQPGISVTPESLPAEAPEEKKEVHPIYRSWDSERLTGGSRIRYQDLLHKNWDWRSFYNGWLEGRVDMLKQMRADFDALQAALSSIKAENEKLKEAKVKRIVPTDSYFVAECERCGFKASSKDWLGGGQIADTGDYDDVYCPVCGSIECGEAEDDIYIDQRDLLLKRLAEAIMKNSEIEYENYCLSDSQKDLQRNFDRMTKLWRDSRANNRTLFNKAGELMKDRDLYRKESEMYQSRYSALSEEIGKRNVEVAELSEERDTYRRALRTFAHVAEDASVKLISWQVTEKYPKKEQEQS